MQNVKITNLEVRGLIQAIDDISTTAKNIPVKIFYALSRSRDKLATAMRPTEATRLKLVEQYGEDTPNGKIVKEENNVAFNRDWQKVMEEEIDCELYKIRLDDFEKEVKRLDGVGNIHLVFQYLIDDGGEVPVPEAQEDEQVLEPVE